MESQPMRCLEAWIDGVGLLGTGLEGWVGAKHILGGQTDYEPRPIAIPSPSSLPPPERRRVGLAVKVALAVAHEAVETAKADPARLAAVFASSGADGDNCDAICRVLASEDRHISPTRFHNSVHNASAGYWGIASGAMTPATVLCAYDASFGAGLLEAVAQVAIDGVGTLLVAYDAPYPDPLHSKRPLPAPFGLALTLMPHQGPHSLAHICLDLVEAPVDPMAIPGLESLRRDIPAARGLPMLTAIVGGRKTRTVLEYLAPLALAVDLAPCR
jgi:hypothetical protein